MILCNIGLGGGDDAPFPKKMLDYLYILMPPPPLQGRTKKKSKGGEVLFVSAPFCSVIFPPPQYIIRFNPPPLLFQSRRGGGNIRVLYLPPSFLRPCSLEKPRYLPKIFLRNHWFYMILWNIGWGGGGWCPPSLKNARYNFLFPV